MATSSVDEISIVIPAFNEEGGITSSVEDVIRVMESTGLTYELIVVDDGSQDRTAELAEQAGATVVAQPENQGYGAALKAGIRRSRYDVIVITDADGTYPADQIPVLVKQMGNYDEIWERNVGQGSPYKLPRGINSLVRNGGIIYSLVMD